MHEQSLLNFDNLVWDTCSHIDINDNRCKQLSVPVRWRGLEIRSAVMLAPSAYLASAASTAILTHSLPDRLHDIKHPGITSAKTARSAISGHLEAPIYASSRRAWDHLCLNKLLTNLIKHVCLLQEPKDPVTGLMHYHCNQLTSN